MRTLITGGAGLVGSQMCEQLLSDGSSVFCVDNFTLGSERHIKPFEGKKGFEFERWDVAIPDWHSKLKGREFDVLIHLAANSDISLGHAQPRMEFERTLVTTLEALLAAKALKIPRFLFSSSSAVYGADPVFPTPEDSVKMHPVSNYGAAKLASENFISSFVENYGLNAWVFRFGNVVGQKLTHGVIYDFLRKLEKNPDQLEVLGNGQQNKTYIDVQDCVAGILLAMQKSPGGTTHRERFQVFNLSTEGSTSVRQIAEEAVQVFTAGKASEKTTVHYGKGSTGWVGDVPRTSLATEKVRSLGWRPKLESTPAVFQAIREHFEWMKQERP